MSPCEYALCRRAAELSVVIDETVSPLRLCGLHLTPVLTWGLPAPIQPMSVELLPPPAAA